MDSAWAAAAAAVATAVLSALVSAYIQIRKTRHEQDQQTHGTTVAEYRDIVDRQDRELEFVRERYNQAIDRAAKCYQERARAEERICALEDLLTANDIPFRRFVPRDGDSAPEMIVEP